MERALILAIAVVTLAPVGVPAQEGRSPPKVVWDVSREPSIVVTGTAELFRPPDEAELVVGAVAEGAGAAEAQDSLNRVMTRTIDSILETGAVPSDVHTLGLSVRPVYDTSGAPGGMKIIGYRAENAVAVRMNPDRVARVLDAAMKSGANSVDRLSFGLGDDDGAKRAVLREAFAEARSKAAGIASAAGFELGDVLEVVETAEAFPARRERTRIALTSFRDTPTPIEPGETELRASVSVRFAIRASGQEPARTGGVEAPPFR